jgi:hypothetical protein
MISANQKKLKSKSKIFNKVNPNIKEKRFAIA